jgi:parallel beta-helix repeat protein
MSHTRSIPRIARRLRLESLETRITPATLFVDDDGQQFPNAPYSTIQAAVDDADPGDRIFVATGLYEEQVVVGDGKDDIQIKAAGNAHIVAPDTFGDPSNAIVHIDGAEDVDLIGFTIRGTDDTVGPNYGVLVDGGGSADILRNRIFGVRDNPLTGRQEGVAIQFGQFNPNEAGNGSAVGNRIDDYQKGGIVVIGDGSSALVAHNRVRGAGPTDVIAQNGIQVSDGATGRVEFNFVSGNAFTGPEFEGVGILVFDSSNVRIRGNHTYGNDEGILLFGDSETVTNVTVELNHSYGNTFNGIGVFNVQDSIVRLNHVSRNAFDGINLEQSSDVQVTHNVALFNGRDGIALEADATGNMIRGNVMLHNDRFDASDASTGTGTAGTANTWTRNHFRTSNPEDLD